MIRITGYATDTATLEPTIGKKTLRIDLDTLDLIEKNELIKNLKDAISLLEK